MVFFDRVKETSTTTGTGNITLAGAVAGYRAFSSVLSVSDTVYYCIQGQTPGEWESGVGTYSGVDTLTRTTPLAGSAATPVSFSAGTKDVFITVASALFTALPVKASGAEITTGTDDAKFVTAKAIYDAGLVLASIASGWFAAGETWTYAAADSPSFTFTITGDLTAKYSVGMRLKLTQATGGTKYFIVTKVSYGSPNTTMTIYGGTDYTLNGETISAPYFSAYKTPVGFPLDPTKWTIISTYTSNTAQATPTVGTWYNIGSFNISVAIGVWNILYSCLIGFDDATAGDYNAQCTLSTANNSESDNLNTTYIQGASVTSLRLTARKDIALALTAKTTYYFNLMTSASGLDNIRLFGSTSRGSIKAICAYL